MKRSGLVLRYFIDGILRRYLPNFLIETSEGTFIVETKSNYFPPKLSTKRNWYLDSSKLKREALEEIGITIHEAHPFCWTTEDHSDIGVRSVTLYHVATAPMWGGEPQNLEPHKCSEFGWFNVDNLPDPLFPGLHRVIRNLWGID